MINIHEITKEYLEWTKRFKKSTPISSLKGLKREADECISDIEDGKRPEARIEYADCLMYLLDSANRYGLTLDDLFLALKEKLEINKLRSWEINDDKSYSHVK